MQTRPGIVQRKEIIQKLKRLTSHEHIEIVLRGNSAILSALTIAKKKVLIPEEGGWLTYLQFPKKLGLESETIKCNDAVIDLKDLKVKLNDKNNPADVLLYQNPGGYHAEQPIKEIYSLCKKHGCKVILDLSGGIGTRLCDGNYADILVCSFGEGKLIEAHTGGFISCRDKEIFDQIKDSFKVLNEEERLKLILKKIEELPQRIKFLTEKRKKILSDLKDFYLVNKTHLGFVVVVKYNFELEKEKIISYCQKNHLEYTECPRYIRLNQKAISIEVKRLVKS